MRGYRWTGLLFINDCTRGSCGPRRTGCTGCARRACRACRACCASRTRRASGTRGTGRSRRTGCTGRSRRTRCAGRPHGTRRSHRTGRTGRTAHTWYAHRPHRACRTGKPHGTHRTHGAYWPRQSPWSSWAWNTADISRIAAGVMAAAELIAAGTVLFLLLAIVIMIISHRDQFPPCITVTRRGVAPRERAFPKGRDAHFILCPCHPCGSPC